MKECWNECNDDVEICSFLPYENYWTTFAVKKISVLGGRHSSVPSFLLSRVPIPIHHFPFSTHSLLYKNCNCIEKTTKISNKRGRCWPIIKKKHYRPFDGNVSASAELVWQLFHSFIYWSRTPKGDGWRYKRESNKGQVLEWDQSIWMHLSPRDQRS